MDNQTQPNIPPFQPQSQIQTPVPPSTNWGKVLLFILLGLIIITGSVFAGIQIGKKQIISQQLITEQSNISPTQTIVNQVVIPTVTTLTTEPNPTADWKTYINSDAKIFFKYPSTLSISNIAQGAGIIIKIIGLEKDISLAVEPSTEHDFYTGKKVSETLVFNNISWSYLTGDIQYCDGGECGGISDALRTTNQGKRYTIILGNLKYPEDALNQILSTFKFIK